MESKTNEIKQKLIDTKNRSVPTREKRWGARDECRGELHGEGCNRASGGDHSAVHTGFLLKCCAPETFRYFKKMMEGEKGGRRKLLQFKRGLTGTSTYSVSLLQIRLQRTNCKENFQLKNLSMD